MCCCGCRQQHSNLMKKPTIQRPSHPFLKPKNRWVQFRVCRLQFSPFKSKQWGCVEPSLKVWFYRGKKERARPTAPEPRCLVQQSQASVLENRAGCLCCPRGKKVPTTENTSSPLDPLSSEFNLFSVWHRQNSLQTSSWTSLKSNRDRGVLSNPTG